MIQLSFNQVTLMGNLTRDPELKFLTSGTAVCSFSLALNEVWKDEKGERHEYVNYIDCEAWAHVAEAISEYHKKGDPILVTGSLRQDRWKDKETEKNRSRVHVRVQSFTFVRTKLKEDGGEPTGPSPDEAPPF